MIALVVINQFTSSVGAFAVRVGCTYSRKAVGSCCARAVRPLALNLGQQLVSPPYHGVAVVEIAFSYFLLSIFAMFPSQVPSIKP